MGDWKFYIGFIFFIGFSVWIMNNIKKSYIEMLKEKEKLRDKLDKEIEFNKKTNEIKHPNNRDYEKEIREKEYLKEDYERKIVDVGENHKSKELNEIRQYMMFICCLLGVVVMIMLSK